MLSNFNKSSPPYLSEFIPVLPFLLLFPTATICLANDFSRAGKKLDTSKIVLDIFLHTNFVLLFFSKMVLFEMWYHFNKYAFYTILSLIRWSRNRSGTLRTISVSTGAVVNKLCEVPHLDGSIGGYRHIADSCGRTRKRSSRIEKDGGSTEKRRIIITNKIGGINGLLLVFFGEWW